MNLLSKVKTDARYGVQGFNSALSAMEHAKANFTEDDFIILHNTRANDYAWVWPPEFGRSLLSELIVEVERQRRDKS